MPGVVVVVIGQRRHALPLDKVERVERMAALTPLPGAPRGVVGALNVRGRVLPVVDPRPWLGLPTPPVATSQSLIAIQATTQYMLWVDQVERIVELSATSADASVGTDAALVVRLGDEAVPLLSLEALDPGPAISEVAAT